MSDRSSKSRLMQIWWWETVFSSLLRLLVMETWSKLKSLLKHGIVIWDKMFRMRISSSNINNSTHISVVCTNSLGQLVKQNKYRWIKCRRSQNKVISSAVRCTVWLNSKCQACSLKNLKFLSNQPSHHHFSQYMSKYSPINRKCLYSISNHSNCQASKYLRKRPNSCLMRILIEKIIHKFLKNKLKF